jgi:hypothetical protein
MTMCPVQTSSVPTAIRYRQHYATASILRFSGKFKRMPSAAHLLMHIGK